MLEINGNIGEGGGQILRTALALSMLTRKPFHMTNIRAGRPTPGIKTQHLECINALCCISNSKAEGATLGSQEITFFPDKITKFKHNIKIDTAGSIGLILQCLLLPLSQTSQTGKKVKLTITGGTDVEWATPVDFLQNITFPLLTPWTKINCTIKKRGYYPSGGGLVSVQITPQEKSEEKTTEEKVHRTFEYTHPGELYSIKGISHSSQDLQNKKVAERQANAAKTALLGLNVPIDIRVEYVPTQSTGAGITLWAISVHNGELSTILGADALGKKEIPAEPLGKSVAEKLLHTINSKTAIDLHTADNLIPWMAIHKPAIITTEQITQHTLTNIEITKKFLEVQFTQNNNTISCQ